MRACVIFNPTAKGDKARHFRTHLDDISGQCALKPTSGPGHARRLAAEAVGEGFDVIAAAGGDGTVNETLNGIGDAPGGFEKARFAVVPLGTVNVFARELAIPRKVDLALKTLLAGRETRIDLPRVAYGPGLAQSRYFAQLAGAGLDARAIELVSWSLKKKIGPLAYVLAGLKALCEKPANISVAGGGSAATGSLVLLGNGALYGGPYRVFPQADLTNGRLEVCVFPRTGWLTLARCAPHLLLRKRLPASVINSFSAESVALDALSPTPLELDGELIGHLPARFTIERQRLRVIVP